jgi:hypothetical protein
MKTKLFAPVVFLLLVSLTIQAQDNKIRFGVLGGLNFQNINGKDASGDKLENNLKLGFHLGANAMIGIAPEFYFQPGLLLTTKGTRYDVTGSTVRLNISYIEVPLNLLYRSQLGNGNMLLGFGPYLAFGVGGKLKPGSGSSVDIKFRNEVSSAGWEYAYLRRFDSGANIFFGYELPSGLFGQINAQLGMLKINPKYSGTTSKAIEKNTGFGISVGYRF